MSQIVLVTGTPVLSTTLYSLKIYHFLSHLVQSTATSLIWPIPPLKFGKTSQIVLVTVTPVLSTTILAIKKIRLVRSPSRIREVGQLTKKRPNPHDCARNAHAHSCACSPSLRIMRKHAEMRLSLYSSNNLSISIPLAFNLETVI